MPLAQRLFLVLLAVTISATGRSQVKNLTPLSPTLKLQTLTFSFGAGIPQSRQGITAFWDAGPSGSMKFMVNVSKPVALGIGLDAAMLKFNEGAFRLSHPTVPVQSKDILLTNVYLAMKYSIMPSMRLSPYVGVTIGASHLSEAVYGDVIDSVRVSYYNIPGRTRLSLGISFGADVYLARWLACDIEAKTNYMHNDPDIGMASFLRGGLRFTL